MGEGVVERESVRIAFGQALADYGAINPDVVVLDADVSSSTQTQFFAKRFPDRFFNLGVAEANLVDVAAGLALGGKIPFANAFSFLLSLRAGEQVRTQVCLNNANVKVCGAYGGLSDSFDGPTHHSESDLAVMRALPGMTVVVVGDAREARSFVRLVAEHQGPVYLRLSRAEVEPIGGSWQSPEIGRGILLRDGTRVTIVGTGTLLPNCLRAADLLGDEGISCRVIEIHTIKPIDVSIVEEAARVTGAIVTVEEHSVIGGLGAAVAETLSERWPVPVVRVGLADTFAETGPYADLLEKFGMGPTAIAGAAKRAMAVARAMALK
jgi:transketolase